MNQEKKFYLLLLSLCSSFTGIMCALLLFLTANPFESGLELAMYIILILLLALNYVLFCSITEEETEE